jgi:uncharacterized cofD-like protein
MALAALCGDDTWGSTWARVLQHRFSSNGELDGHSLGNLLITALWEETDDLVEGLDWVARLLDAKGKVLPLCIEPLEIFADVVTATGQIEQVRGQVQVATTPHVIQAIGLEPKHPAVCEQAVAAVRNADFVVVGPGSWYTSVLPHFQVPQMVQALHETTAGRILVVNLRPQSGETEGYSTASYLEDLTKNYPDFVVDYVLADLNHADKDSPGSGEVLEDLAKDIGAELVLAPLAKIEGPSDQHDPALLASAFSSIFTHGRIKPWQ